jgi:inositol-hexakisphosphate 5-kinase
LTQALATNYEADESAANSNTLFKSPETLIDKSHHFFPLRNEHPQHSQRHNGLNADDSAQSRADKMAMIASASAGDLRSSVQHSITPASSAATLNLHNMSNVNSLLSNHRQLLNKARGRGTSLERTEKEKRIQELPKGPMSTNPGDTGMSRPATPQSPSTPESISTNPPTDGVRARYRSWRDARPAAAERAWSIDQQGSDDSGQVENSIKEALAGVEPNSRSRKASHSLRFFKEGLPEDKSKKRDNKSRGQSKEGVSRGKGASAIENGKWKQDHEALTKAYGSPDGRSPLASPLEREWPSSNDGRDPILNTSEFLEGSEAGYFDISPGSDNISEGQMQKFPAQLLADIRKNHNLTPGASKGSSFSRSIPVTASEKSISDASPEESASSKPHHDQEKCDDSEVSQPKTDEEDDSGEEQISSAFFVPHQTPHESPKRERDESKAISRPPLQRQDIPDVSNSQEWLEEHAVPSRDVDEKYLSKETKSRPLPSPTLVKPPISYTEKEPFIFEHPDPADVERDSLDEGYSTKGDESGLTDDQDSDTTPTGSLQRGSHISNELPKLHHHQQDQQQPLDAIELIPYRHQVGGHTTMWRFSKRAVCKQLNNRENEFYEKVERYHPKLLKFLPRYVLLIPLLTSLASKLSPARRSLPALCHSKVHNANEPLSIFVQIYWCSQRQFREAAPQNHQKGWFG